MSDATNVRARFEHAPECLVMQCATRPNPQGPGQAELSAPRTMASLIPAPGGELPLGIRVVGVGGAGGNVVDSLAGERLAMIDTLAVNTDRQALMASRAGRTICLGEEITRGLGAGGDPNTGRRAAEESAAALFAALRGAEMVFLAAGMGGGTGTGAAPIVAEIARQLGALTVALVTRPFSFEGRHRARLAEQGLERLRAVADTVIVVPNDRLIDASARDTTVRGAFAMADTVLRHGVQGLADLITCHGMINVDFADVRAIMGEAGPALLGLGIGSGPDRAVEAARRAMACPLLEGRLEGSRRLLLNIAGGDDLGLFEVQRAAELVSRAVAPDANIIFGATSDPTLTNGQVKVTLVATGFSLNAPPPTRRVSFVTPAPTPTPTPTPVARLVTAAPRPPADPLDMPPFLKRFERSG
jgi:cell division protein FtsZ